MVFVDFDFLQWSVLVTTSEIHTGSKTNVQICQVVLIMDTIYVFSVYFCIFRYTNIYLLFIALFSIFVFKKNTFFYYCINRFQCKRFLGFVFEGLGSLKHFRFFAIPLSSILTKRLKLIS